MDSLPQEIIEVIIDNLPRSSLRSSSLVARRWRTRSQQRILSSITFFSQDKVDRWHSDVKMGRNGTASYVRSVTFHYIYSWNEPALFVRVLKGLHSLRTLETFRCAIPNELVDQISCGEFGDGITTLSLRFPNCELSAITSMILSLPNLKKLAVSLDYATSIQPPSTSIAPRRGSLDVLDLYTYANEVAEALIRSRFTSRYIRLGNPISSVHRLLAVSSETLEVLALEDNLVETPTSAIDLPSFPALTSLRIRVDAKPSRRIINILSSISSTPVLASICIQCGNSSTGGRPTLSDTWNDLDRWLARAAKHPALEGGLVLNLRQWKLGESPWEVFLPRFREAGGKIQTRADGWIDYD